MKYWLPLCVVVAAIGCSAKTDTTVAPPVVTTTETATGSSEKTDPVVDPAADATEIALTAENTLIQFVGTHVGEVPDPKARTGSFADFTGVATIADDDIQSVNVAIQMASVDTGMDKLNNHLQAPDFFDVRQHPTAEFTSTRIARDKDGRHIITGDLTLHGETKEVSFPADVGMTNGELKLAAKLKLDRTEFGMDKMTDKVNSEVALTIKIGK